MLKVMLVDDEPFILQGLKILIDWEKEGYEIVAALSNGKEALDYLKENEVDLIISDIQMPVMTGLELLETIQKEGLSKARFAILTGFDDFSYAQRAIKNNSMDYILKPVQKKDILALLRNVSNLEKVNKEKEGDRKKMEDAYLARNVIALIKGKYDESNIEYVKKHMQLSGKIRYVDIELVGELKESDEDDYDMRMLQHQLHNACRDVQKENLNHFIFDVSYDESSYDVGFIYCENMATRYDMTDDDYLEGLTKKIEGVLLKPVRMICGKKVNDVSQIAKSYSSCRMLNSIKGFHNEKRVYIYEDEVQIEQKSAYLCKKSLDECIAAIEKNEKNQIEKSVEKLYEEMYNVGENYNLVNLNINYLLFQLIHLASEQDDNVNQEEVIQYISENSFENSLSRGSREHMKNFALQYADYLMSLRKNVSRGILSSIEKDISEHYAENISLRNLGEKYYMNSSYLGQVFRKKYNVSFKDYLTNIRINEAAKMLLMSDKKINQIAEEVGYMDCDYFIRKFIEIKGCTPSKYRKNNNLN
ncbi:MAG: response regulator [Lachnospiraceae bacterium]|nr:response regulator [Lachnospiraceae bacterium]